MRRTALPRLLPISVLGLATNLVACGAIEPAAMPGFEVSALNATWYGGYHRPLEPADPAAVAAAREAAEERRQERAEARAERRRAREEARAERDRQRDTDTEVVVAPRPVDPEPTPRPVVASERYQPEVASAYVRDTYAVNDAPFADEVLSLVDMYRLATRTGSIYHTEYPAAGDVVFFSNTWDRNGDGRDNDYYTHAGVVESVDDSGTISVLSYLDGEVSRTYLNLLQPHTHEEGGRVLNTPLRSRRGEDGSAAWLSSHLFAGFAAFLGPEVESVELIDVWQPSDGSVADVRP
jgi:hypothetical protein